MRILVLGGTGKIGRQLVSRLRDAGVEAMPASRHPGPDGLAVDLADPHKLASSARGFDCAYLTTPLGPEEAAIGVAAVEALHSAGVKKIVYLAIHNLEQLRAIPHFETKIPVKQTVLRNSCSVVLQPNFFFQNDLMAIQAIRYAGVYPLPVGSAGIWSIDVADIATAAANALLQDRWDGTIVPLCGPERLTGPMLAQNWADALGSDVRYGGDDIAPFIAAMRANIPDFSEWMTEDFEAMMRVTQHMGCQASDANIAATEAIVGRPLTRHKDFVHITVEENRS